MKSYILSIFLILIIVGSVSVVSATKDYNIPSWVKQSALWWGEEKITDSEFISSIEYLVNNKIIQVSDSKDKRFFDKYKMWAKKEIQKYKDYSEELKSENEILQDYKKTSLNKINDLNNENIVLGKENKNQQSAYYDEYDKLIDDYNVLVKDYNSLNDNAVELDGWIQSEQKKPKTTIQGGVVTFEFYDSKENYYVWELPIETYEEYVYDEGYFDYVDLRYPSGKIDTLGDFTVFVEGNIFENVIDDLYDNSENDYDFLKEVWYVTSNFSTYQLDIGEYPRFAVETFVRGSGDCEDTVILLAEMLKSSKHTKDWTIQFVYFDGDNPSNPQIVNHVALYVSNGDWGSTVETTSSSKEWGLEAYDDITIQGWSFDV